MFEKTAAKLRKAFQEPSPPPTTGMGERFGDPLADRTEWTAFASEWYSFRSRKFHLIGANRAELQPTFSVAVFGSIFALVGAALLAAIPLGHMGFFWLPRGGPGPIGIFEGVIVWTGTIIGSIVGLAFALAGIMIVAGGRRRCVFDRTTGMFWIGRRDPQLARPAKPEESVGRDKLLRLAQVYALQLIRTRVIFDDSRDTNYELNLVLHDASRVSVVSHGEIKHLRGDAQELSQFLGVPLWDAAD